MFFLSLGIAVYMDLSYAAEMPRSLEPTTGRIHQLRVNHGSIRYVSQRELQLFDVLANIVAPVVCFGSFVALLVVENRIRDTLDRR
jgi:hypothetical protein